MRTSSRSTASGRPQPVPISTTILAVLGQIELHLTAHAPGQAEADAALESAARQLEEALGAGGLQRRWPSARSVVGDLLREKQLTIAVAESCTGGLLASRLTDVPGSSAYVERGVVCYSNQAEDRAWLGVPEDADPAARRGQRAGGRGDGRRHSRARADQHRHRHHRHRRTWRRHAGETSRARSAIAVDR